MGSSIMSSVTRRPTLRARRRLATWAYVFVALGAGIIVFRAISGSSSRVEVSWATDVNAHLSLPHAPLGWTKTLKGKGKAKGKGTSARKNVFKASYGRPPPRHPASRPQESESMFQAHRWRHDGLLEVNAAGRHPIFDLIERAQADWDDKLARQSKSLDEAVAEYRRRYGRAPPKGFDRWWDYVEANDVSLPDEYDMIHHDLEPYWAYAPNDLRAFQTRHESHPDSWTMGATGGHGVALVNMTLNQHSREFHLSAAEEMLDTLRPVQEYLQPFHAVFNPHDTPYIAGSADFKAQAHAAIKAGKYLDIDNTTFQSIGWLSSCTKASRARTMPYDLEDPPLPSLTKTFIYDHFAAMDPCTHPQILHQHGQFLSHEYGPGPTVPPPPVFSYSSSRMHMDIRVATPFNWMESMPGAKTFADKTDDRLLWRGSNTGIWHEDTMRFWRQSHRERLVVFANEVRGSASVLIGGERDERFTAKPESTKRLNGALLDVEFAGGPILCAPEACEEMQELYEYVPNMRHEDSADYKYLMDVDGNGWSSRFKRLITSEAVVFKASIYPEWFTERIQPWVHYVPVQFDYSDVYDALAFFRGDAQGVGAHPEEAARIAKAGTAWSRAMWRPEDLTAYNFRLMLEYARLMAHDRNAASYVEPDDGSW